MSESPRAEGTNLVPTRASAPPRAAGHVGERCGRSSSEHELVGAQPPRDRARAPQQQHRGGVGATAHMGVTQRLRIVDGSPYDDSSSSRGGVATLARDLRAWVANSAWLPRIARHRNLSRLEFRPRGCECSQRTSAGCRTSASTNRHRDRPIPNHCWRPGAWHLPPTLGSSNACSTRPTHRSVLALKSRIPSARRLAAATRSPRLALGRQLLRERNNLSATEIESAR